MLSEQRDDGDYCQDGDWDGVNVLENLSIILISTSLFFLPQTRYSQMILIKIDSIRYEQLLNSE